MHFRGPVINYREGATKREGRGRAVKFYPYIKGGGGRTFLAMLKRGGGGTKCF